jgi:DNA polymerase III subunit alpha
MNFTHLHTHSHYSLLDGLSKIKDMVKLAKEYEMPALALTDHGAMYGAIEFYNECIKNDIKPIIGCEVYIANRSRLQKEPNIDNKRFHLTLLAKDNEGYQNLIKLNTAAHLEGYYYKPRIDKELLSEYAKGLICLSGCPGSELGRTIQSGNLAKAETVVKEYQSIFGPENYYLEIMHHPDMDWFPQWKEAILNLSQKLNIPLVATQDSHYLNRDDAFAHKTLIAISTQSDIADTAIFSGNGEYHFISPKEAIEQFKDIPEAVENTQKIADRCNIDLTLGKFIFPNFELEPGKTADQMLNEITLAGAQEKNLSNDPEIEKRRQFELEIIKNKHYAPYFLVVADLLRFAREKKIYNTVRGSAAGSLVAYLAGITNVNPIEFKLPFERFLNPYRPSAPDIDMDFADNRRAEVIEYAKKKYGEDKVAQIGTFGTMLARGAVRDVARALGKSYETGDRIAKLIHFGSQGFPMTVNRALEIEPQLKELYESDPEARHILDTAKKLEGTVRHVSVHAAGIVIAPKPLSEYVPIQLDPKGKDNKITQYDMYAVGEDGVGLLKLDILGIRNLAILEDAVRLVKNHRGIEIDIEKIPFDDKKTFKMLSEGETEGVFQLGGSEGMTRYLKELKPTSIDDLNAMVALYRPGPINNINEYIARKHGKNPIKYFHPKAEKFLAKSYGVLVYQDDLLMTALELAGYNWETVDKFRKAVGKKIPGEMAKQHEIFVKGCQTFSNMTTNEAEAIWNLFEPFQGYGFNKAHAACYGRVAYQTAYMKANFPAEYMCAVLSAESGDTERIAEIINECQRMNIPVLPPDINNSFKNFTVIKSHDHRADQIMFGLLTIKNLGENIADAIIAERENNGQFKTIEDFVTRVAHKDLNKKSLESLIKCGALDSFGERNVFLHNLEDLLSYGREIQKHKSIGQVSLFGQVEDQLPPMRLREAPALNKWEKVQWEKELLGLFVSEHPMKDYQEKLKLDYKVSEIKEVMSKIGQNVKIGGLLTKIQKVLTRNNQPMIFSQIEDTNSKVELIVFNDLIQKNPALWQENNIVVVSGRVNEKDGVPKIICQEVTPVATLS